ncbi:MAG TPA: carboxylesterase family protein [Frankiaceae bacterium]|jgi:para-nitrobenzyl esterase|nr:carboxylesterase family protein [Frankiaceae bacterium]
MPPTAEIESGRLEGLTRHAGRSGRRVAQFLAIPYAAPPVGPLRFRAPQPPIGWAGTRDATRPGPAPMQSLDSPFSGVIPGSAIAAASEDCLTVDVWAPAEPGEYPVLVWMPGGAFLTGGSSLATYDGAGLAADENVVVVGVNYRLGAFGFGWFGEAIGDSNCGLRDQLAALSWVKRNISAFGGNPGAVTAMGESAGAGALLHLLASPESVGAVDRYILRSPGVDHTLYPDDVERVSTALLRRLSLSPGDVGALRTMDSDTLLQAQEAVVLEMMPVLSSMPFHPFVEGQFLPSSPSVAIAGGAGHAVDLMISWTSDEMRLFPTPSANTVGIDGLVRWTRSLLTGRMGSDPGEERSRQLVDFYVDLLGGSAEGTDVWAAISTDGIMRLPARRIADAHAAGSGHTYATEFAWHGPAKEGEWDRGCFHAIDLPFTFGTLDVADWREFLQADKAGGDADEVASALMHAHAQFAASGEPGAPAGGAWPQYETSKRSTVVFDAPCRTDDDPLATIAQAWDGLWTPACRAPALDLS